ncbi:hypothetical protein MBELCI_2472 [Limimaricola cinnabarinus LL-001]|uniref:Uncharacterized protein n=1 Tax=Limimaricola cinnabarinus LL-001 TaxID=1337093 RepID=U2Z4U3_9RHOB|nr:hypothetical protein MBELCI_2472 [Limimaricola cinnabarinus LL-001]
MAFWLSATGAPAEVVRRGLSVMAVLRRWLRGAIWPGGTRRQNRFFWPLP